MLNECILQCFYKKNNKQNNKQKNNKQKKQQTKKQQTNILKWQKNAMANIDMNGINNNSNNRRESMASMEDEDDFAFVNQYSPLNFFSFGDWFVCVCDLFIYFLFFVYYHFFFVFF